MTSVTPTARRARAESSNEPSSNTNGAERPVASMSPLSSATAVRGRRSSEARRSAPAPWTSSKSGPTWVRVRVRDLGLGPTWVRVRVRVRVRADLG